MYIYLALLCHTLLGITGIKYWIGVYVPQFLEQIICNFCTFGAYVIQSFAV